MKRFNTAGTCRPNEHYMVDITERLGIIRKMVAKGDYFCINRGRQYGKTTTLAALQNTLDESEYTVLSISFEGMDESSFQSLGTILFKLVQKFNDCVQWGEVPNISGTSKELLSELEKNANSSIDDVAFSRAISNICKQDKVVLLIDEVDQASNSTSFIQFLGLLREMYLKRDRRPTFQSVILAGVYDIKNLKLKVRPDEKHQQNSPWNIAVPFNVDMSLSTEGIKGMLDEYETDHHKGINTEEVASWIREYTGGYPFLVSRICQIIDTEQFSWDKDGILKAVNAILVGDEPFWKDAKRTIENDEDLKDLLQCVIEGQYVCYEPYAKGMKSALEHDFIKRIKTPVEIASPLHEGYLLSFCFRSATKGDACQSKNKQSGLLKPVELNGRTLIEAIV